MGQTLPPEQLCFSTPAPRPARRQAATPATPTPSGPTATPAPITEQHALQLRRNWHSAVAVGLVLISALLAAAIWSFLTPHLDYDEAGPATPATQSSQAQTQPAPAQLTPATPPAIAPTVPLPPEAAAGSPVNRSAQTRPISRRP